MKKITFGENKNVIHAKLAQHRKMRGLTQAELAARLQLMNVSIDQQMISRIERNCRIVTDYVLLCFCRVLNISVEEMTADFDGSAPE